ncbi:MAG: hypothetical protein FGM43_05770 [Sinobacteraceae bacterium]|nr:hypothetical protein [Nevskiaceae bacterium]
MRWEGTVTAVELPRQRFSRWAWPEDRLIRVIRAMGLSVAVSLVMMGWLLLVREAPVLWHEGVLFFLTDAALTIQIFFFPTSSTASLGVIFLPIYLMIPVLTIWGVVRAVDRYSRSRSSP